ncbi:MAG: type III polyketide synthase [Rhodospirillaceae bacterium]
MTAAYINRIGTAVPDNDVHASFIRFVDHMLPEPKSRLLFKRMAQRAEIEHRYSYFEPGETPALAADRDGFYRPGHFATTADRMKLYEERAIELAVRAFDALGIDGERSGITHLIVTSCTGFGAPGLDHQLTKRLRLNPSIERTLVGFMGCSAAVNALRLARHTVRSEPSARVLIVNLELCTLHLQDSAELEKMLGYLLFGDGSAASLVTAEPNGIVLDDFRCATIPDSEDLLTWSIGDSGFEMTLSGEVPSRIGRALRQELRRNDSQGLLDANARDDVVLWAVHPGGRTILDAVQQALELDPHALCWSRDVLRDYGNMSSATLMFVLERMMRTAPLESNGVALAFGPGLVAETFRFRLVA